MKDNNKVIYWLLTGCVLIFIMVVVGGITRLTHSGLSISNYKLISGTIPPMNEIQWQEAFDLYKQYPEYQKINQHFTLEDFKDIYFWEWLHRIIGRLLGIIFSIPFLYFLFTKQLTRSTIKKSIILLCLGGFQGFIGWYMVKSGLIDRPDVSHYRLALHLSIAFLTFCYALWVAMDLKYATSNVINNKLKRLIQITFVVLMIQIIWGAFVAGLDAGLIHNHWPLMNDRKLIHETVTIEQSPIWRNFIEGNSGVQFVHRYLAYIVVALILIIWRKSKRFSLDPFQEKAIKWLLFLVLIQFILGVFTLILQVPVILGVLHQVVAFFLLAAMTFTLHRFSK
jgi:Uncharacterized protein required for cytochrome oxidase assembly